jgi:hypothetical protein
MDNTDQVGKKLVELCSQHKNIEALDTLFTKDAVSVEAMSGPDMPATTTGLDAIKGKNEWWVNNHEIHSSSVKGPFPHGDRFAVIFNYDVTPKAGPGAGKRMKMEEVALYTLNKDGKITREEFFYTGG